MDNEADDFDFSIFVGDAPEGKLWCIGAKGVTEAHWQDRDDFRKGYNRCKSCELADIRRRRESNKEFFNGMADKEIYDHNEAQGKSLKHCSGCGSDKLIRDFYTDRTRKNGIDNVCRDCHIMRIKNRQVKNRAKNSVCNDAIYEAAEKRYPNGQKRCGGKCRELRHVRLFHISRLTVDGLKSVCQYCESMRVSIYWDTIRSYFPEKYNEKLARDAERKRRIKRERRYAKDMLELNQVSKELMKLVNETPAAKAELLDKGIKIEEEEFEIFNIDLDDDPDTNNHSKR